MNIDQLIKDGQDPKVVEKIYDKLKDMLTTDENIKYVVVQKKPAVTILPDTISVTNKRIFLCEFTKLGFAINFEIFNWKDIKDIVFKEELFGSKVTLIPTTGENLTIDYIPKVQARKLFQYIREVLDQHKSNKKSYEQISFQQNSTEEKPAEVLSKENEIEKPAEIASAPIIPITEAPEVEEPIVENEEPVEDDELTKRLQKLKTLFDKQLISKDEYESKKAELLKDL